MLETLIVGGCQMTKGVAAHDPEEEKMFPQDFDISLSLYDTLTTAPTKTKVRTRCEGMCGWTGDF